MNISIFNAMLISHSNCIFRMKTIKAENGYCTLTLSARGLQTSESDVYILTSQVDPYTERVKYL